MTSIIRSLAKGNLGESKWCRLIQGKLVVELGGLKSSLVARNKHILNPGRK